MLTRFHKALIGLLAVQLLLVIIVLTRGDNTPKQHVLVPDFDVAKVTRVQVSSSGDAPKTVDLVKKDSGWVVASSFDYPADQTKVSDALTPIAKLSAAEPVATQVGRHKQLKVADNDFERKLVITRDGKDITLYIGGSAGARRTAFRVSGDDKVYGVTGLSTFTIAPEPRQWVDTSYVKIAKDEIAKITVQREGSTIVLGRSSPTPPAGAGSGSAAGSDSMPPAAPPAPEHWNVEINGAAVTPGAGESLDEATIDRLVGEVATITQSSPADPKRDASKPTATITVDRKASGTSAAPTVIDVILDGSSYWVHDRSVPRAVLVDKSNLDEVVNMDRDKLVKKPPPPPPTSTLAPGAAMPGGAMPGAGPGGAGPAGAGVGSSARPMPPAPPRPAPGSAAAPPRPAAGSAAKP